MRGSRHAETYELRSRLLARADGFVFMNHGYAGRRDAFAWVRPEDRGSAYHLNLVRETIREVPVDGRDVLDVGCGRGGTCSYLARYHRPRSVRGLDYTAGSVAFCARRHRGLRFVRGDAHALPFGARAFHVVVNVESSHCYPALGEFLGEVWRVLRRRGAFCYADLMPRDDVAAREKLLERAGFRVEEARDVTANVVLALERNKARLRRTFRSMTRSLRTKAAAEHLRELERGIHEVFLDRYRRRSVVYRIWRARKP